MIRLWKEIIFSPFDGFAKLDKSVPVWKAFFLIMVFASLVGAMLIPVITSQEYRELVYKLSVVQMQKMGQSMSNEQLDMFKENFNSSQFVVSTVISTVLSMGIMTGIGCLLSAFMLWLISLVFKTGEGFKRALAVSVYAYPVYILGMAVKNLLVLASDYKSLLLQVRTNMELGFLLSPPFSLASFLSPSSVSVSFYNILNTATDVFFLLFVLFLYAAFLKVYGMEKNKALTASIGFYIVFVLVSSIFYFLSSSVTGM
ncbi:YIP1 family protein [Spirochaetia bacterium 38H-sp]|uniref:YIP1 family protein n=1 Tax=Rarispira pelagica TaxID=3141764 RepID=A0ABU9UC97_9SPIR